MAGALSPSPLKDRHVQQDCWVAKVVSRVGNTTRDTHAVRREDLPG